MNHKYKKKPVTIEAFQVTEESLKDSDNQPDWFKQALAKPEDVVGSIQPINYSNICLQVYTLEGYMNVSFGDYIIQGIKGELYSYKEDIFKATYEEVD